MGSDFQGIALIFTLAPGMQSHLSAYPGQLSVAFSIVENTSDMIELALTQCDVAAERRLLTNQLLDQLSIPVCARTPLKC